MASLVAEVLNLNYVPYKLGRFEKVLCARCGLFIDINTGYVTMYDFIQGNHKVPVNIPPFVKLLGWVESNYSDLYESLIDLFMFDFIIENRDRHLGNYGILKDNNTNELLGLAPIFDNGLSLLHGCLDGDNEM